MSTITIRSVRRDDLETLAALDQRVWRRRKDTPILTIGEFRAWYEEDTPFFLVAECDGRVCGYYFGHEICFHPKNASAFIGPKWRTGRGYSNHPHAPGTRECVYGISVVATDGAGAHLKDEFYNQLEVMGIQYFIGFTRLSGLAGYCRQLEKAHGGMLPYDEADVVLWYAHESMRLLGKKVWTEAPPCPDLPLPRLRRPDPVLAFHVRDTNFGLLGIQPGYMPDAASRDYGACILSSAPHR